MLSKSAEYAIRAVHRLAFSPGRGPVTASRLAREIGVPENYLSKLLHRLQKEGVVESSRGRGGGFSLARDPSGISLAEVIEPFDEELLERHCLLGRGECRDDSSCSAHQAWLEVAGGIRRFFRETSVRDLGPPEGHGDPAVDPGGTGAARDPEVEAVRSEFTDPEWNL